MIKALLAPYLPYLYGAAAIGAVVVCIWGYNTIYDRGWDAASVSYEQKMTDQKNTNDLAIKKAEEVLRGEIGTLIIEKERLIADVERLSSEAAEDPHAADGGIERSSVQRVNSIR